MPTHLPPTSRSVHMQVAAMSAVSCLTRFSLKVMTQRLCIEPYVTACARTIINTGYEFQTLANHRDYLSYDWINFTGIRDRSPCTYHRKMLKYYCRRDFSFNRTFPLNPWTPFLPQQIWKWWHHRLFSCKMPQNFCSRLGRSYYPYNACKT